MSTLERAIQIAAEGHAGQRDKGGAPYILHPLRMMLSLEDETARIVALHHDVVEDLDGWSFERLRQEGFTDSVVAALDAVTKRDGESYDDFARRAGRDPVGRRVKLADLRDNSDLTRIAAPTPADHERLARDGRAIAFLEALGD